MCPADTSPEAWKVFIDIQRRLSPSEKFQRAIDLSMIIRRAAEGGLREKFPRADDAEIMLRLKRELLGDAVFETVYGPVLPPE